MRDVVIPERGETSRDDWVYDPPASVDVKEVWFSGDTCAVVLMLFATN